MATGWAWRTPGAALSLFLFFQGFYALTASGNTFRVPDEFEVYFQAEHFVDAGDLSVPQTLSMRPPIFFGKVGLDRKPYAPYGPLAALLALPHHLAGRAVAWLAGVPRGPLPQAIAWLVLVAGLTSLATTTAAALVWAAALLLEARRLPETARDRLAMAAFLLTVAGLTKVTRSCSHQVS